MHRLSEMGKHGYLHRKRWNKVQRGTLVAGQHGVFFFIRFFFFSVFRPLSVYNPRCLRCLRCLRCRRSTDNSVIGVITFILVSFALLFVVCRRCYPFRRSPAPLGRGCPKISHHILSHSHHFDPPPPQTNFHSVVRTAPDETTKHPPPAAVEDRRRACGRLSLQRPLRRLGGRRLEETDGGAPAPPEDPGGHGGLPAAGDRQGAGEAGEADQRGHGVCGGEGEVRSRRCCRWWLRRWRCCCLWW